MPISRILPCENWIFDWSGTLVDDLVMVLDATNHVLRQYGKSEIGRDDFRSLFRLPYEEFYQEVIPGVPLAELEDHFRVGFADSEASGVNSPLLPHAVDFLSWLHERGKRMFILTSMDSEAFHRHARELGVDHYFEAMYAGVLDKRDKIHSILDDHGLSAERTVFIGDMRHDIETARHGGIASIAVLTGYQNADQLSKASPDLIVEDLAEIRRIIETASTDQPAQKS